MAEEKILTVNLRKKLLKVPRWERGKGAMKILKRELRKHTKAENVKIDSKINEKIKSGKKLRIKILKVNDKTVKAELV